MRDGRPVVRYTPGAVKPARNAKEKSERRLSMPDYRSAGERWLPFVAVTALIASFVLVLGVLNAGGGSGLNIPAGVIVLGVVAGVLAPPIVLMHVASLDKEDKSGRHRRHHRHGHGHRHRTQAPDTGIKPAPADEEASRGRHNREGITAQKPGDDRVRSADTSFIG
jgi:hypothetical protein